MHRKCTTTTEAAAWLRGFFDGEGSAIVPVDRSRLRSTRWLSVTNTDEALIEEARDCLTRLGIRYTAYYTERPSPRHRNIWTLRIVRQSAIVRFIHCVGSSAPAKRSRMAELLWLFRTPSRQFRSRWDTGTEPSRELLGRLHADGLTFSQIARALGCDRQTVSRYMYAYALLPPRAPRCAPSIEDISRMYWIDGLTTTAIARQCGYSAAWVLRVMQTHGVPRREAHVHCTKLTQGQVDEIRVKYVRGWVTQQSLADEYGVTNKNVSLIVLGKSWPSATPVLPDPTSGA